MKIGPIIITTESRYKRFAERACLRAISLTIHRLMEYDEKFRFAGMAEGVPTFIFITRYYMLRAAIVDAQRASHLAVEGIGVRQTMMPDLCTQAIEDEEVARVYLEKGESSK